MDEVRQLDDGELIDRLGPAIEQQRIVPAFQPIVSLDTRAVAGFEVLARWHDPEFGFIPPVRFIPLAESLGLLAPLTSSLIRSACTSSATWEGHFSLAFNISPLHFQDSQMPELLEEAVGATSFPLSRVQIEITETAVIGDLDAARATIRALRDKGVTIALDDFGTGYSSLSRLQALDFNKLKIDASFVAGMDIARDSRKIVAAIVGLGQSLGMPVVAEGVETQNQADLLRRLGCDLGQGWLFGRALPPQEAQDILQILGEAPRFTASRDLSTNQRLAQLETVLSSAPIGLCFVDRDLRILQANRRWALMLDRAVDDVVGQTIDTLLPAAWSDLQDALNAIATGSPLLSRSWSLPNGLLASVNVAPVRDEAGDLIGLSLIVL